MSDECMVCKNKYNKSNNIPYMLECGDTLCSKCISHYTESYRNNVFKCPSCCNQTHSLNIENKACYPKDNTPIIPNCNQVSTSGEFDVTIKFLDGTRLNVRVTKSMTVGQLISKIAQEKGMNEQEIKLSFKQPLKEKDKTLEFYKIKKSVTIQQVDYLQGGA